MSIKSREAIYLKPSGEKADPGQVAELEAQKRTLDRKKEIKHNALDAVLNQVNFDLLNGIISEIGTRCGIERADLNLLDRTMIFNAAGLTKNEENTIGSYSSARNAVYLDGPKLTTEGQKNDVPLKAEIFSSLCHELTHAASKQEDITKFGTFPYRFVYNALKKVSRSLSSKIDSQKIRDTIGYHETKHMELLPGLNLKDDFFKVFNEGVTEKLGLEIFTEYCRRDGGFIGKEEQEKLSQHRRRKGVGYAHAMELVDNFTEAISKKTGVEARIVWQGIVHGYMTGQGFEDSEVGKLFGEMFGPDFLAKLSKASSPDQTRELAKKYLQ